MKSVEIRHLKSQWRQILQDLKHQDVVLKQRKKSVAVLIDFRSYNLREKMLDLIEDYVFGTIACEREKRYKKGGKFYTHEEVFGPSRKR